MRQANRMAVTLEQGKASVAWRTRAVAKRTTEKSAWPLTRRKIWIDLDNTPHIPFFLPIIEQLKEQGYEVFLTARDIYQVCDMLEMHHLTCTVIGRHWGKNRFLKVLGTLGRAIRLLPLISKEKPDLAVSHGSRTQTVCCS